MYDFRPRNKSVNAYKLYLEEDEDSFSPKKNKKKNKYKTKNKTKNKRANKKSSNIKPEKRKTNKYQKSNELFPKINFTSDIQDTIDYSKVKTKKYQKYKSKEKFIIPTNKKDNKRKKESNGDIKKEYKIKEEKYNNIKIEDLEDYDYIKNIDDNKRRYNTIHFREDDKGIRGKAKNEQNRNSAKRGNSKLFEKAKKTMPKEKNNKIRNTKIEYLLNKSYDYDRIYNNKYKNKSYSHIDLRKTTNKNNFSNDKKRNYNNKNGPSYNNYKCKVILDDSEEEDDINDIYEKPKNINIKNIKILEEEKNNKYEKDKSKYNQKGKYKVEKSIKKNKVKIKKEEKEETNRKSIKVHNNIVDIDKSLLNDSFDINQYLLSPIYYNQNNFINKKKASDKSILNTTYTEFGKKSFKYSDKDLEKYKYSTCQIDDELFTITLNRFPKSNDIQIKLEKTDDEGEENNINLLGNKRKRNINIKKEKVEDKKSNKKTKKRNYKVKKEKEKEVKIKKEKQQDKEVQKAKNKKNKSTKNEKRKNKKQKASTMKASQSKKEIEYYEDDNEYVYNYKYNYNDDIINNNNNYYVKSKSKRGTKKHRSMKKKEKVKEKKLDIKVEIEKENHEDDYMISSCSSLSDGEKNTKKLSINDSKNSMKSDNNKNKNIIIIKSEKNSEESESEQYQKMEGENSPIFSLYKKAIDENTENKEIKENNILDDNINDITINKNNISIFSNKQYSYSSFENSFDYSFPIEYEDKIQIKEDVTYFGRNTRYIKYNPIDEYATPIPIKDKKPFKNKITKPKYVNFLSKSKKDFNTIDSDLTDITSNNNNDGIDSELPAILCIPRIKPFKEDHSKKIINKLKNCRIPQHKILDEKVKKEEQNLYIGSFILYDENNNIKVNMPCFRENEIMMEFMRRKNLGIIEFQEDNDIDTDEEQLQLEVERNNEALINFMKKVENDKEYVENNLTRKKRE